MNMSLRSVSGIASAVLFAAFFANVAYGAVTRVALLGNVAEFLLLVVSALLFVVSILAFEAAERRSRTIQPTDFQGGNQ